MTLLSIVTKCQIGHTCVITIINLPFVCKWIALRITAGCFQMFFGRLCYYKCWHSTDDPAWSHITKQQYEQPCHIRWEYNRILCKNKVKGHSQWSLWQPLNFHVTESLNLKSAQSPFIRGKYVIPVRWFQTARWTLAQTTTFSFLINIKKDNLSFAG